MMMNIQLKINIMMKIHVKIIIRMNLQMTMMMMMNMQVNIIPVIGKSDCCTKKEIGQFKAKILR